jgi:hypothetical protein
MEVDGDLPNRAWTFLVGNTLPITRRGQPASFDDLLQACQGKGVRVTVNYVVSGIGSQATNVEML